MMKQAPLRYFGLLAALALGLTPSEIAAAQRQPTPPAASATLAVKTAPGATVWVDSVRYCCVPASGELTIKNLRAGTRVVRARLKGKREIAERVTLLAGAHRRLELSLSLPADEAELRYQTAEELRERGDQTAAIKAYREAIRLRGGRYAAARTGLARSLMASEQYEEAVAEAQRAARERSGPSPEAHTVIANTQRAQGLYEEALTSYRTALAQARDFSPEAHTGVALTYEELNRPAEAIKHFRLAAAQSNDTEPVIYFLLGNLLEREQRTREAIEAYEKYLQLEPQGRNAPAVRSMLKQLRREAQP
jgi:tetratricopeptide (TPR) repeat protein